MDEATSAAQAELAEHEKELEKLRGQLAELKVVLYGRLGSSNINLEE